MPLPVPENIDLSRVAAELTALGVVATAFIWLFRDKIARWVDDRISTALLGPSQTIEQERQAVLAWRSSMEERMSANERTADRITQTLEHISEKFEETTQRQTIALERMAEKLDATARTVERIDATMERRSTGR